MLFYAFAIWAWIDRAGINPGERFGKMDAAVFVV